MSQRLERLLTRMKTDGLDAVAVIPGPTFIYLTGLSFHLMERPAVLLIRDGHKPVLVLSEFERSKADRSSIALETQTYGEDPGRWPDAFAAAARRLDLAGARIGVEPLRMRVHELRFLEGAAPTAEVVAASGLFESLRIVKDPDELDSMRRAVAIAETAVESTLPLLRLGMTEKEIAAELTLQLLRGGSETELPFQPIVASGPNSALPHWVPGDRTTAPGDLLIIDWGATVEGYISDITRTFSVGNPDQRAKEIHKVVHQANATGRAAVRPGASGADVDEATRKVIADAGFGEFFLHRTGHGIGMEAHEPPYIRDGNLAVLEAGMTFTVEPGIYLPDFGGVRIEDNLVMTNAGGETMTSLPRELRTICD